MTDGWWLVYYRTISQLQFLQPVILYQRPMVWAAIFHLLRREEQNYRLQNSKFNKLTEEERFQMQGRQGPWYWLTLFTAWRRPLGIPGESQPRINGSTPIRLLEKVFIPFCQFIHWPPRTNSNQYLHQRSAHNWTVFLYGGLYHVSTTLIYSHSMQSVGMRNEFHHHSRQWQEAPRN